VISFVLTHSELPASAQVQRVLGTDISYWNCGTSATGIHQTNWNTAYTIGNRVFCQIRATRGGTTGLGQTSGTPSPHTSQETLTRRYDDSRFLQNITRATVAGMVTGPYHFARPDIAGNTGTDEANHFIEMAGIFMRPGYMMPMYDLEATAGDNAALVQFSIDFSARIYAIMQIRPCIYINGNYSSLLDSGSTAAQDIVLAQPPALTPSVVGPAYPMLWNARYSDNTVDGAPLIPIQTGDPKTTYTTVSSYYGAWDDYGNTEPWTFWQYASVISIPGINNVDSGVDGDVCHGDIEYLRNYLVPAVWWNDTSGDWNTLANWNSGQPAPTPITPPDQATPYAYTTNAMPIARLPGAAGSGPTSGQYDTVILERPSANIVVTLSSGTYNVRKLYVREILNIIGGSLTVNYNPAYRADDSPEVLHAGPLSAQFSSSVALSNSGALSVHTLQMDNNRVFTLAGGTLTFNAINLMPHASAPAKILMTGDVNFNPLANVTAVITNGAGSGNSGLVDLGGGTRAFNVGNGTSDVDLSIYVPIINGALTKTGAGTMRLSGNNTFTGNVTINGGTLRYGHVSGLANSAVVIVNNGGILDMNGFSDSVAALASSAGQTTGGLMQGPASLTLMAASGTNTFGGNIIGSGAFIKNGASIQVLNGNNSLGLVTVNTGSLLFNGTNTTGGVTVNSGGTIGGTGTISGAVIVNSAGTLSPGASIGTLTLSNAPTFGGTNFMEIDRSASPSADRISLTSGTLNYGGTLVVSNVGATLEGGEVFTLFNASTYSGAFASMIMPGLNAGLNWDTGGLVLNGAIKVNRKPVAAPLWWTNTVPAVLQIFFGALTGNATDADGDLLTVVGVNLTTTNGVTLTTNGTSITYSNSAGAIDQFSYTISDGHGGTVTSVVNIVNIISGSPTAEFVGMPLVNGSSVTLNFAATPGWTYYLERSTNLPVWVPIWTNVAPPGGVFDFTDTFPDLNGPPARAFYQLRW